MKKEQREAGTSISVIALNKTREKVTPRFKQVNAPKSSSREHSQEEIELIHRYWQRNQELGVSDFKTPEINETIPCLRTIETIRNKEQID